MRLRSGVVLAALIWLHSLAPGLAVEGPMNHDGGNGHDEGLGVLRRAVIATREVPDSQNAAAAAIKNPIAPSTESTAAGKQTYTRSCAPCHGTSGEGGPGNDLIPAAPDLTDAAWDHGSTDGEIFATIKDGVAPDFNMTPFKDRLKDDEIWNVVNYLRSIAKNKK